MRFNAVDNTVDNTGYKEYLRRRDPGMHIISFVTVPVKVEYRFLKDIIRPYAGVGVGIMVAEHKNPTEERIHGEFHHNRVVPTTMIGLNLEYKHFIFGFAKRIDLKRFWYDDWSEDYWRIAQTTIKIGYRIF